MWVCLLIRTGGSQNAEGFHLLMHSNDLANTKSDQVTFFSALDSGGLDL